jgi:hypothetical protein
MGWALVSFIFVFLPPLRVNVPQWFSTVMAVPFFVAFIWFLPMVLARLIHQISWPIRKLNRHFRDHR